MRRIFQIENAFIHGDHGVDQRDLVVQSGRGNDADRLTETYHQRLARLIDGEQRAVGDDERDDDEGGDQTAEDTQSHRPPPVCGVVC